MKTLQPYMMTFNERTNVDLGVWLYDYEEYSGGGRNRETTAVAGRRGEIVGTSTYTSNLVIGVTFSVFKDLKPRLDQLRHWLRGTGQLSFSDQMDCFYKVLAIDYGDFERELRHYGRFGVSFTCAPFKFRKDGQIPQSEITSNPYDLAQPIYKIEGEGLCTLSVNGNEMTANIGQNLTIDTERLIAYRQDGTLMNTSVTGDYEDLWIPPGDVEISITSGFDLKVIPQWGYEI